MIKLTIKRGPSTPEGTFGDLELPDGTQIHTGELPWVDKDGNGIGDRRLSCVSPAPGAPSITYLCKWQESPKHGWCYHLQDVKDRDFIEIHTANFMGSVEDGFQSQLEGCIAPGMDIGVMVNIHGKAQRCVTRSGLAMKHLLDATRVDGVQADFELEIVWQ